MYKKEDLKLLNTNRALEYLMQSNKLDFDDTLQQLRFERELAKLQAQLINIQKRIVEKQKRVLALMEGREFAGKGGVIHVFTEHLNPREIRTVALDKPTSSEQGQWYFERYIKHLPQRGEMVFFDRSWYNRAVVEPVMGFCTKKEYAKFMREVNHFERMLSEDGIKIIKFYFSISKREQQKRIEKVRKNPLRRWELSPVDLKAIDYWDKYTKYEKELFKVTNTDKAPWYIFKGDDKRVVRIKAFKQLIKLLYI